MHPFESWRDETPVTAACTAPTNTERLDKPSP